MAVVAGYCKYQQVRLFSVIYFCPNLVEISNLHVMPHPAVVHKLPAKDGGEVLSDGVPGGAISRGWMYWVKVTGALSCRSYCDIKFDTKNKNK